MQVDDPPYLSVGTAVSAKYKGAFCEAKVSKVDRVVKCKVTFRSGIPSCTVSDNEIKGTLRVGQQVQVKLPEYKELIEANITKIQDCSQYTVVFDDGDITTLRRTALCIKSGRHFNESETLDQLPLTHPEHFGIPVMGGRRGRRNRLLKDESSDEEIEEENEPDLEGYTQDIGRVVSVETGENKRGKEKWFPGLIVIPSAQPTVKINVKDEFLIRSFRDDRYYTVPKKEVNEFARDITEKIESTGLAEAIQKANKFLDSNELPLHWEKSSLFNISTDSDSDDNASDTSDEEQSEEKDRFVAQLYKFMDDSGTPLNKTPMISGKDIDLHRLFRIVHKMGGYNRVTNQSKWKSVSARMRLPINHNVANQVKSVYKKCLLSYEGFFRTLGVTMSNPIRPAKKDKGRSLIRDKDRTPISSPKPERDDDSMDAKSIERKSTPVPEKMETKPKKKPEVKAEKDSGLKKVKTEVRDASSDVSDSPSTSGTRPKRVETKPKEKKAKSSPVDKVKVVAEKAEDAVIAKVKDEKVQFTRSKSSTVQKPKESSSKDMVTTRQSKETTTPVKSATKQLKKSPTKEEEDKDKKPKLKKKIDVDKASESALEPFQTANLGDKLIVYYGPTNESKVTYEAKVVDVDKDLSGPIYLVHYTGWNTRYDEWIPASRIAENLSSGTKSKRSKVPAPVNVKQPNAGGGPSTSGIPRPSSSKRNRVTSISSRGHSEDKLPRSSTPSSVTSSGSVSKSPATRSNRLAAKQESHKRRFSAQTDVSVQSESDSEEFSESDADLPRTRSGSIKPEESEAKGYRKRAFRPAPPTPKSQKRKEIAKDDNSEKDETDTERKSKRLKRSSDKSESDEEDSLGHPKGRDFDLNQIRSELKGFSKALKVPAIDVEKDVGSSSEESEKAIEAAKDEEVDDEEEEEDGKEPIDVKMEEESKDSPKCLSPKLEPSSSSEDVYEFKEPEPFEFESRSKLVDDKNPKKRSRIFDSLDSDKSPRRRVGGVRSPLSPGKNDKLGLPEPRTYSRVPKKLHVSDDEESDEVKEEAAAENKSSDAFDKLIESPCFNIAMIKPETSAESKDLSFNETSSLLKEAPESMDEYSRDMDLSDCEFQAEIITREDTLFAKAFSKTATDENTTDFSSGKTDEGKTTNSEDDDIRAQIQKAIAQSSSTDDEMSSDLPIEAEKTEALLPQSSKEETNTNNTPVEQKVTTGTIGSRETVVVTPSVSKEVPLLTVAEPAEDTNRISPPKRHIDPALQETDSSLLESIVSKPPLILKPNLDDTGKELTVKTGTKIADSILQKFNFIKNKIEPKKGDAACPPVAKLEKQVVEAAGPSSGEVKLKPSVFDVIQQQAKLVEETSKIEDKMPTIEIPIGADSMTNSDGTEARKRSRKPISKPIIDESESDSSDSENLVIGSDAEEEEDIDDDDSRHTSSSDNKPLIECKTTNGDSSVPKSVAELAQAQTADEEKKRNFAFENLMLPEDKIEEAEKTEPTQLVETEEGKCDKSAEKLECKEEQDPNLHSLLCEEEIPRSPAPPTETMNPNEGTSSMSVHEMPFASAPGSSNSKILLEPKKQHQSPPPPPPLVMPMEVENRVVDAQAVIENTPPTTPESTISNLSPRGDNGNVSPNSNDSKSNEGENDYVEPRSVPTKVSPYSEEDTQAAGDLLAQRKPSDPFGPPSVSRKRRGSLRTSEDGSLGAPKRGRKTRQRRESDSDDASETSMAGSVSGNVSGTGTPSLFDRGARSPRPSKYNFMDLDPTLDNGQRIVVLQQKLTDLRKTYQDVKAELAIIERRRKKIKRREREALKSAKQEVICT